MYEEVGTRQQVMCLVGTYWSGKTLKLLGQSCSKGRRRRSRRACGRWGGEGGGGGGGGEGRAFCSWIFLTSRDRNNG